MRMVVNSSELQTDLKNDFCFIIVEQLWTLTRSLHKKYYPISRAWAVTIPAVELSHPDDVEVPLIYYL